MPYRETSAWLAFIGAAIALAKLLNSEEKITLRTLIGRIILGSAVSQVAGVALLHFDDMHPLALVGIACALGIAGFTVIEIAVKHWLIKKEPKE
ncbi:holin [Edaphovirga cremea]|uniref:holin n=1 Tax=Edaphovirga cremea TaxID=2267246 RepID=UPI003989EBF3